MTTDGSLHVHYQIILLRRSCAVLWARPKGSPTHVSHPPSYFCRCFPSRTYVLLRSLSRTYGPYGRPTSPCCPEPAYTGSGRGLHVRRTGGALQNHPQAVLNSLHTVSLPAAGATVREGARATTTTTCICWYARARAPAVARAPTGRRHVPRRGAVNASTRLRCAAPRPLSVVGHREFIVGARRHTRRGH